MKGSACADSTDVARFPLWGMEGGNTVPGAGVEPARLAALVFETSASTDSAIRATFAHASLKNRARAPIDSPKTGTAKVEKTCDTAKSNHAGLSENTVSLQNMMSGQKKTITLRRNGKDDAKNC